MKNQAKLLLFDIDATLLLAGRAGRIAMDAAFQEVFHIPNAYDGTVPHGKTDPIIFREITERFLNREPDAAELERLGQTYTARFRAEIPNSAGYRVLPGVKDLLDILSQREDITLGIQTGNLEETAWLKLERGDLRRYFRCGGFASDALERTEIIGIVIERSRSYAAAPLTADHIFVIGDAEQDIRAGKEAGVRTIAVTTGRSTPKDLAMLSPDHILQDLTDIKAFLEIIGG